MVRILFSTILLLAGCKGENQRSESYKTDAEREVFNDTLAKNRGSENLSWTNSDSCEVVKINSGPGRIQSVFVVIKSQLVYDTSFIRQTICKLKTSFPLDDKSNISFFSEKKYADYKDELFFNSQRSLPESEYPMWLENYYLGEFHSEKSEYIAYPASSKVGKRKVFSIPDCS